MSQLQHSCCFFSFLNNTHFSGWLLRAWGTRLCRGGGKGESVDPLLPLCMRKADEGLHTVVGKEWTGVVHKFLLQGEGLLFPQIEDFSCSLGED